MKQNLCLVNGVSKIVKIIEPDMFGEFVKVFFDDETSLTFKQTDFDFLEETKYIKINGTEVKLLF